MADPTDESGPIWAEARKKITAELEKQVAHIVYPMQGLVDVIDGTKTKTKALCGKMVTKIRDDAPVCRTCFEELMAKEREAVNDAKVGSAS